MGKVVELWRRWRKVDTHTRTLARHRWTREEMRPTRSWREADREDERGRGFCRGQRSKRVFRPNMAEVNA